MTNDIEKLAAELAEEIIRFDMLDDITPIITQALTQARAAGYREGAEKMREVLEAMDYISLSVSYIIQQNALKSLDAEVLKSSLDSIQKKADVYSEKGWLKRQMDSAERSIFARPEWISKSYSPESRLAPITPPQPEAKGDVREGFERWIKGFHDVDISEQFTETLGGGHYYLAGHEVQQHWQGWQAACEWKGGR